MRLSNQMIFTLLVALGLCAPLAAQGPTTATPDGATSGTVTRPLGAGPSASERARRLAEHEAKIKDVLEKRHQQTGSPRRPSPRATDEATSRTALKSPLNRQQRLEEHEARLHEIIESRRERPSAPPALEAKPATIQLAVRDVKIAHVLTMTSAQSGRTIRISEAVAAVGEQRVSIITENLELPRMLNQLCALTDTGWVEGPDGVITIVPPDQVPTRANHRPATIRKRTEGLTAGIPPIDVTMTRPASGESRGHVTIATRAASLQGLAEAISEACSVPIAVSPELAELHRLEQFVVGCSDLDVAVVLTVLARRADARLVVTKDGFELTQ